MLTYDVLGGFFQAKKGNRAENISTTSHIIYHRYSLLTVLVNSLSLLAFMTLVSFLLSLLILSNSFEFPSISSGTGFQSCEHVEFFLSTCHRTQGSRSINNGQYRRGK